ncbi:unnamed protein product [Arctia plantaginis]|uniref:Uncharacterized protein n=1 Tax=Arctia plantaginis TaxID=874455 RepID=A0A8S1ARL9_ARCPL|nr:unnamed protein product [Arctia plantaginis]CAB3247381.1 unnamed protein product [Arctia plantaginis]
MFVCILSVNRKHVRVVGAPVCGVWRMRVAWREAEQGDVTEPRPPASREPPTAVPHARRSGTKTPRA